MTIRLFMLWHLDYEKLKKLLENANCEILQEDFSIDAVTVNFSFYLNNYVHLVIRDRNIIFIDHRISQEVKIERKFQMVKIEREDFSRIEVI